MKLLYREVKAHREKLLQGQGNRCALCGENIVDDAVLDHCHKTGKIRRVLHRGCNAMLGKIENNLVRNKMTPARLAQFALNLVHYVEQEYEDIVHPTYLTTEEKKMKAYKKKKKPVKPGKGKY
ncbi:recombination endonuclease VII [uncultured Caudovirales phage]|uniref:Recombination endonuclease VII n=1 Tax=uncultured Caudovirales phage TaxID=2100421 RepID=A0A6J5LVV5_9CAUD|nr:recombination endonuclease VII [uncultured Caudovirales phage]CAB4160787.1 recombination endonuclease VII [uncultured Caudovirales phage]CAB4166221.1 recombination endonuclease VII [uncultured Caudovirales phage]